VEKEPVEEKIRVVETYLQGGKIQKENPKNVAEGASIFEAFFQATS